MQALATAIAASGAAAKAAELDATKATAAAKIFFMIVSFFKMLLEVILLRPS